jgi:hypothetical protein
LVEYCPALADCRLGYSEADQVLTVVSGQPDELPIALLKKLALRICAATSIRILSADSKPLYRGNEAQINAKNKSITLGRYSMGTATLEQNSTETVKTTQVATVPILLELDAIALRAETDPGTLAAQINGLGFGLVAGFDPSAGTHKAPDYAVEAFADSWVEQQLDKIRREQKRLLLEGSDPVAVAVAIAPVAPAPPPETRFKVFKKSNTKNRTLAEFLKAQGYGDRKRVEVFEAIAKLPNRAEDTPPELAKFEAMIQFVLNSVSTKPTPALRLEYIAAARNVTGE